LLIKRDRLKFLINIKPKAPNLNAYIKTYNEGASIRPVINSRHAPSYKTAKLLNKKLLSLVNLTNTFITKKSYEVAQHLHNIQLHSNNRLVSLDIKDLFTNLPFKNILHTTEFWLSKNNNDRMLIEQTLHLLQTVLEQNYFQHNNQLYQSNKGITVGSPISSTLAEIYLQYLEEKYIKHCLEHKDILYYRRYIDDLLLIYDQSKISADKIHNFINHNDVNLEFQISEEINNTLPYLNLSISRSNNNVELDIYRKPSYTDMIHYTSNHLHNHKLAAFIFYINRMISMPITCQATNQEWHKILTMATNNGFPEHIIHELKKKLTTNKSTRKTK